MERKMGFWFKPLFACLLFAVLALAGCEGDDGAPGPAGPPGPGLGDDQFVGQTPNQVIAAASFVGSTQCLSCHGNKQSWGHTLHKTVLRAPGSFSNPQAGTESFYAGTINAGLDALVGGQIIYFDLVGTSWSAQTVSSADTKYRTQIFAPTDVANPVPGQYTFQITPGATGGTAKNYKVLLTYGGERNYKQRYVVVIGNSKHISPIQYNDKGTVGVDQWVHYHAERWVNAAATALAEPGKSSAFDGDCAGCHFTGYSLAKHAVTGEEMADAVNDPNGALDFDGDGKLDEINIGCESCHGAGSAHVATLNPVYIVNPANLTPSQGNMICGQCHIRGKSADDFTDLFNEATVATPAKSPFPARFVDGKVLKFRPGIDNLSDYYVYDSGVGTFDSQYWGGEPSGGDFVTSKQHHQQYIDILQGPHAPDKSYDPTCFSCHDSHDNAAPERHQVVTSLTEDGVLIKTQSDNDTLCLACHAGHGPFAAITLQEVADMDTSLPFNVVVANVKEKVTAHTQHYFDPTDQDGGGGASRCTGCHLPLTAKSALAYDIHSHTFNIIQPQFSLSTAPAAGVPNACNSCHTTVDDTDLTNLQLAFEAKFPVDATGVLLPATNVYFDQWASSGHADYAGEPLNHWNTDGSVPTSCAKCHSKDGFVDFAADGTVDAAAKLGTTISCGTCHTNGDSPMLYVDASTRWDNRVASDALDLVLFPSGATASLGDASNMCMACHQGRSSTPTVDARLAEIPPNLGFSNIHYFAAAASLFGTDVQGGYEYSAATSTFAVDPIYAGQNLFPAHPATLKTCTGCHLRQGTADHTFTPDVAVCIGCHGGTTFATLGGSPVQNQTDITALKAQVLSILTGSGVTALPGYPYFSGITTAAQLKAAYNWQVADKEPCGYIHNGDYIKQLLYDSIVELSTDLGTPVTPVVTRP